MGQGPTDGSISLVPRALSILGVTLYLKRRFFIFAFFSQLG